MTKAELIKGLSEEMGITKKEVETIIGQFDTVIEYLTEQDYSKTKIGKYMTVEKVHKEEKKGIALGKEYTVKPHDELKIKATKALKDI